MRTVVLYGTSLGVSAIAGLFDARPEWRVVQLDPHSDNSERLQRLHPEVVIVDLRAVRSDLVAVCRARTDVLFVGVDLTNQQALVLTSHRANARTTRDLMRLVLGKWPGASVRSAPTVMRKAPRAAKSAGPSSAGPSRTRERCKENRT